MVSLKSLFGGDAPERRGRTGAEQQLLERSDAMLRSPERSGLTNLRDMAIHRASTDQSRRRSAAIGRGAADVAQAADAGPARPGQDDVALITRRARAASKQARGTSDQFNTQALRDRLGIVRRGRGRQGVGLSALADVASMREQIAGAQQGLDQTRSDIKSNQAGALLGAGLGFATAPRPDGLQEIDISSLPSRIPPGGRSPGVPKARSLSEIPQLRTL